jgi:hypothetical protein
LARLLWDLELLSVEYWLWEGGADLTLVIDLQLRAYEPCPVPLLQDAPSLWAITHINYLVKDHLLWLDSSSKKGFLIVIVKCNSIRLEKGKKKVAEVKQ